MRKFKLFLIFNLVFGINSLVQAEELIDWTTLDNTIGGQIFKERCSSCHGEFAQLNAFGYSRMIAGWHPRRIQKVLTDYKRGTYGGAMKDVMQGQVADLSPEQIRSLSKYINMLYYKY
jgi:cytochrome c553